MSIKILGTVDKLVTKDERVIQQTGDTDGVIASFYDLSGRPSLFLDGTEAHLGNVGIKTTATTEALTVSGNIDTSGYYYGWGLRNTGDLELKAGEFPWTIKWATGNVEAATNKGIVGGSYGGNQVMFPNGGGLQLNSLRDGGTFVQTGSAGDVQKTWAFTNDGNLTLPSQGNLITNGILSAANVITPHFQADVGGTTVTGDISATGNIYSNGVIIGALPVAYKTDSFTFALSDVRTVVTVNSVNNVVCSIPATSAVALPIGSEITIINLGSSTVSLNGVANGIDLGSSGGKLRLTAQHSVAFLFKVNTNEWVAYGDLKQ